MLAHIKPEPGSQTPGTMSDQEALLSFLTRQAPKRKAPAKGGKKKKSKYVRKYTDAELADVRRANLEVARAARGGAKAKREAEFRKMARAINAMADLNIRGQTTKGKARKPLIKAAWGKVSLPDLVPLQPRFVTQAKAKQRRVDPILAAQAYAALLRQERPKKPGIKSLEDCAAAIYLGQLVSKSRGRGSRGGRVPKRFA